MSPNSDHPGSGIPTKLIGCENDSIASGSPTSGSHSARGRHSESACYAKAVPRVAGGADSIFAAHLSGNIRRALRIRGVIQQVMQLGGDADQACNAADSACGRFPDGSRARRCRAGPRAGHDKHRTARPHCQACRPNPPVMDDRSRPWKQFRETGVVAGDYALRQSGNPVAQVIEVRTARRPRTSLRRYCSQRTPRRWRRRPSESEHDRRRSGIEKACQFVGQARRTILVVSTRKARNDSLLRPVGLLLANQL